MSSEDRNFRYGYYEKVGFGGIEEKKSLEILLREKPPDFLARLSQLTSRFPLPAIHRKQVWQLLLDVTVPESHITEARVNIQRQIFRDVIGALELMLRIDSKIKCVDELLEDDPKMMVLVFLLQSKQLDSDIELQLKQIEVLDWLCISGLFAKEFIQPNAQYSLEDTYWIFKHFICSVQTNLVTLVETYEKFIQNLANEDKLLHVHLVKNGIIRTSSGNNCHSQSANTIPNVFHSSANSNNQFHQPSLPSSLSSIYFSNDRQNRNLKYKILSYRPIITWFVRFFAGIIHHNFLIRILDKVIGSLIHGTRPFYVLISVSKALITHSRDQLLLLSSEDDLAKQLLLPLSFEESEQIVIKALSN